MRSERVTTCPGCNSEVLVYKARPEAVRRKYCSICVKHDMHQVYRKLVSKYNTNYATLDTLYNITECQCCKQQLENGGGPGIGSSNKRCIDHCHTTGKIRGVLCWDCNVAIGKLGDALQGVNKAVAYLKQDEDEKYETSV